MPKTPMTAALAEEAAVVLGGDDVEVSPLAHNRRIGVTAGVWRVTANGVTAIAKVVTPGVDNPDWRGSHDRHNFLYWRREPLFYAAGLPVAYRAADIAPPELLGSFSRSSGDVSMWLRDVSGNASGTWSTERIRMHARRLGFAQGRCALDDGWRKSSVPLSRNVLRDYLDTPDATSSDIEWDRLDDVAAWDSPLMRRYFDGDLRDALLRLCRERYRFVRWGEALPTTMCHCDMWRDNLFEFDDHTILIDWAFVGEGWLGMDIGNFVSDTALDLVCPSGDLPAFDAAFFRGYCDGLRDVGWCGDERLVRLGMCLMAAKWTWLVPVMLKGAGVDDHEVYGSRVTDPEELYRERSNVFRTLVAWADEARKLAAELLDDVSPRP